MRIIVISNELRKQKMYFKVFNPCNYNHKKAKCIDRKSVGAKLIIFYLSYLITFK
jgi:hypothetical protein